MKKGIASLLAVLLAAMLVLSGCGSTGSSSPTTAGTTAAAGTATTAAAAETTAQQPAYTVKVAFMAPYGNPKDMPQVEEGINKISLAKANVKIQLSPIAFAQWTQQMNLMLASNEKLDLTIVSPGNYSNYVAQNRLIAIDDLLAQYGQDLKKAVEDLSPVYLNAGRINGKLYGICTLRDLGANWGICIRKDIADALQMDTQKVITLEQAEAYLKQVKEKYPKMTPIMPQMAGSQPGSTMIAFLKAWDQLDDTNGVLMNNGVDSLKVVNLYETPEYANLLNTMRRWYNQGLIAKDSATTNDTAASRIKAGTVAAMMSNMKPGFDTQEAALTGMPMSMITIVPAHTSTSNVTGFVFAIPTNCKDPASAMKMWNLMYSDKDIANFLSWGVEGIDYQKSSTENMITYPTGKTAADVQWCQGLGWETGNQLITYIMEPNKPDLYQKLTDFDKNMIKSKAMGFSFDASKVKDKITAVQNVKNQYVSSLEDGAVDPAKVLPQFIAALKANGMDDIVKEKQAQLDAWAKANNVQ